MSCLKNTILPMKIIFKEPNLKFRLIGFLYQGGCWAIWQAAVSYKSVSKWRGNTVSAASPSVTAISKSFTKGADASKPD